MRRILVAVPLVMLAGPAGAQQPDDINRVIDQGLNHSQVMQIAEHMDDRIGPRLTNSPQMRQAEAWTQQQFKSWGLRNVRKEAVPFGRGWAIVSSSVRMTAPRVIQLTAIPVAWTPGTGGTITAPVVVAPMKRERDFEAWRGKLAGRIVLITLPNDGSEPGEPAFKRLTSEDIAKLDKYREPDYDPASVNRIVKRVTFESKLDGFLKAERACAWARMSSRDGKLPHGEGRGFRAGTTPALPGLEIAAEDYRRLARLAKVGATPTLEINTVVQYDDSDPNAYNIFAE